MVGKCQYMMLTWEGDANFQEYVPAEDFVIDKGPSVCNTEQGPKVGPSQLR